MKNYKKYVGPRQVARKRRNRLCVMVVVTIAALMTLATAHAQAKEQAVKATPEPPLAVPTKRNIAYARNYYEMNGLNGDAPAYLERFEEFTAYIVGEKNVEDLVELPDGTAVLPPEDDEVQR